MSQLTTPTIPFEPADECQQGNQQQPPDEPKRPDGVLARLSLFRQEHQEIMALATGRLAKLNEDRRDAMAILQEIEQEIQQIAGMLEAIGAANGPVSVETDSRLAQRVRAPLAQGLTHEQGRAIEFLRTRANVWMTGRRILEEIGCTDKSACHLMNPLIKNGLVEKRGERSGTLYRVIQTVNGD